MGSFFIPGGTFTVVDLVRLHEMEDRDAFFDSLTAQLKNRELVSLLGRVPAEERPRPGDAARGRERAHPHAVLAPGDDGQVPFLLHLAHPSYIERKKQEILRQRLDEWLIEGKIDPSDSVESMLLKLETGE